ncbi:MAG: hypothetical protein Q9216_003042 [Gyalolechia sp. 2 TL-2023]
MASGNPSAQEQSRPRVRPNPGQLDITPNTTATRDQRFSWQDTPLEAQGSTFQQFSSPTNSTIDESPISPRDGQEAFPATSQGQAQSEYSTEKPPIERTSSPYTLPTPAGTHPAYFAPIIEDHKLQQPERGHLSPEFQKSLEGVKPLPPSSIPSAAEHGRRESPIVITPATDKAKLVYNPDSLAGPNAALENHRPGQVAHPNATIEPEWKHGLCEMDTLCCVGLCCPCIIYGKTQYRISRKTQKEDPTNMLGYNSCNSSCGLMALACGFQCKLLYVMCFMNIELTPI